MGWFSHLPFNNGQLSQSVCATSDAKFHKEYGMGMQHACKI